MEEKKPNKVGRPSIYCESLANYICETISQTYRADQWLCENDPRFPDESTLYAWIREKPEFSQMYSRAKQAQQELRLERVQQELDEVDKEYIEHGGRLYFNNARMSRLRTAAAFNQWRASKILSNKYGDKKIEDRLEQTERDLEAMKLAVIKNRDEL